MLKVPANQKICPVDSSDTATSGSGTDRMLWISNNQTQDSISITDTTRTVLGHEFAKVYPNPAKDLLTLVFQVNSPSSLEFELTDELGEPVLQQMLSNSQNFAQFGTGSISNGLYYWTLEDGARVIKTGKVAIMK